MTDGPETLVIVRDNITDLIWEVKNANDGEKVYNNPHYTDNDYSW